MQNIHANKQSLMCKIAPLIIMILVSVFLFSGCKKADGNVKSPSEESDSLNTPAEESDDPLATTIETIEINGVENNMFEAFVSQSAALEALKGECPELVGELKDHYGLGELTNQNWADYYECFFTAMDDPELEDTVNEGNPEYLFFRDFFDIYANGEKNERLKELIQLDFDNVIEENGEEFTVEELIALNLPYSSPYAAEYFGFITGE